MNMRWRSPILMVTLLLSLHASAASALLWFASDRPSTEALEAAHLLMQADQEGLQPEDYNASQLLRALDGAGQGTPLDAPSQSQLDTALSAALLHFLNDRHSGRIDPNRIHARFGPVPAHGPLTLEQLTEAVANHRLGETVQQLAPSLPMYDKLRQALAHYRTLHAHPAWQQRLPALPGRKLAPDQPYAGLQQVAQRLQALGDLPADARVPSVLTEPLTGALRNFQSRHGLLADGILGTATFEQLERKPEFRTRQIELAMERLRWTPYLDNPRMIVVNIPEFRLRAYEVQDQRITVRLSMKVIVGQALNTRTPLIHERMRFIEFNPYWNVPISIATKELVAHLRRDPAYFEQQGFEFVGPGGAVVQTLSDQLLNATVSGTWRLRQRPGPLNALGDIKFVFPNNEHIFLHHTPAPQLFQHPRRDFSHGCIRVEDPVALAAFVLQDQPEWDAARIQSVIADNETRTVAIRTPLPVLIAYSTVIVQGDQVFFFQDVYGHDRTLDQALRQHTSKHTVVVPLASGAQ